MNQLPEKPSELIEVALRDLEAVEAKPETYEVLMSTWHTPFSRGRCAVCLAGAVMAISFHASHEDRFEPRDACELVDDVAEAKRVEESLCALDAFRCGAIHGGLLEMSIDPPAGLAEDANVEAYEVDPNRFKRDMRAMVELLREHGL